MESVKVSIKSSDLSKKITKEEVMAEKIQKDNLLAYSYLSSLGKCTLIYDKIKNSIHFQRLGDVNIKFDIFNNKHSSFIYVNDQLKTEFFLLGNNIIYKSNFLSFRYSLYDSMNNLKNNNNIINKIYISIEEII